MWDTWLFFHDETFFLFYLATETSPGESVQLATSKDGVHWHEEGTVLEKSADAAWLGTGSVWPDPENEGQFILNFSEWFGEWPCVRPVGQQKIRFARSRDLRAWTRIEGADFLPDPRFYLRNQGEKSRWDCIYFFSLGEKRIGYWTANPILAPDNIGLGLGYTEDGIHWQALAPPAIDWGQRQVPPQLECGAVERIGEDFYLLGGCWEQYEGKTAMIVLKSNSIHGPFRPQEENFWLLSSPLATTYFARFFRKEDELLVHHHAMNRRDGRFFSPLKRAVLDENRFLRLVYWPGNEAVKGEVFDFREDVPVEGAVYEGIFTSSAQIQIETHDGSRLRILRHENQWRFEGLDAGESTPRRENEVCRGEDTPIQASFRLLIKGELLELYCNDRLVECHNLPLKTDARAKRIFWSGAQVTGSFRMNF